MRAQHLDVVRWRAHLRVARGGALLGGASILGVVASYQDYLWWIPLIVAIALMFFAGEALDAWTSRRAAWRVAAAVTTPWLVSILWQVVEDATRDYRQSYYSLREPSALVHLSVAVVAFNLAYRGGVRFRERWSSNPRVRVLLWIGLGLTLPLAAIGALYFILALAGSIVYAVEDPAFGEGLIYAHLVFATVLLSASGSLAFFFAKRLTR